MTAQASKAARELSREIADLLAVPATDANRLGLPELLQKSLSDLLEKADEISCCLPAVQALESYDCNHLAKKLNADRMALAKALEPWKAGE